MTRRKALHPAEPTSRAVADIRAWLALIAARSQQVASAARCVYLLVSPLGMSARCWLEAQLQERGIAIRTRTTLRNWPRISTAVQVRKFDAAHLRRAVLYESAWRAHFATATAEAWGFEPAMHARMVAAKAFLRGGVEKRVVTIGPRPTDYGALHGFHLSDATDAEGEASRLEAALRDAADPATVKGMKSFDRATLRAWVQGHRVVSEMPPRVYASAEAVSLSLSLIEAAWPLAENDLNRRLREQDAAPVRHLWTELARRTGLLGPGSRSSAPSRR